MGFGWGEVLGALAGSLVFVGVFGRGKNGWKPWIAASLFFFLVHLSTYWVGGQIAYRLMGSAGTEMLPGISSSSRAIIAKLVWGLFYGVGFGAGLGNAFHVYRRKS